jgi:hypothetical protein
MTTRTYDQVFAELDGAARANLNDRGVHEYNRYKTELVAEGHSPQEVEEILRGFIWDASETGSDFERE